MRVADKKTNAVGKKRRPRPRSRIHQLSSTDLEAIACWIHERYFVSRWVAVTIDPEPGKKEHGGRPPLMTPDPWQLFMVDEGAPQMGCRVDELLQFRTIPARLLCEVARLKASAKQREALAARRAALKTFDKKWKESEIDLDCKGRARRDRERNEVKKKYPKVSYLDEIASSLGEWSFYEGSPSRTTLHRLAAGSDLRKLHAHILRVHLWKRRAFRFITP